MCEHVCPFKLLFLLFSLSCSAPVFLKIQRVIALSRQDAKTQEQAAGKRHHGEQPDEMRAKTAVFHTASDQNEKQ